MPAGQELEGMQKVSTVDAPGRMVMLYHWSLAQEQETALKIAGILALLSSAGQIEQEQGSWIGRDLPLIIVDSPPAKVPSYKVEVVQGIAPCEHSVVIQDASTGKQVDCSMQ